MTTMRRFVFAGAGTIALIMAGLGVAWACTPSSTVTLLPETGPAGMKVNLTGQVAPDARGGSPVEILWNSPSGQILATVPADPNGNFAAEVTVPQAPPGVYYVQAVSNRTEAGRAAFELTSSAQLGPDQGSATRSVSADTWSGLAESNSVLTDGSAGSSSPSPLSSSGGFATGAALTAVGLLALVCLAALGKARKTSRG